MNPKPTAWVLCLFFSFLFSTSGLRSQDVILQGFYWNTIPGDINSNDGVWWDTIGAMAPFLADLGFQTVWTPPANKGYGGVYDMGYGIYDYFDFGQYPQKGSTRTRHGNDVQLQNMISALHGKGINVMADLVLNHRGGADAEQFEECDNGDGKQKKWTVFNPLSNRLPMDSSYFHPTSQQGHCNYDSPYHDPLFFEDLCYFNDINQVLAPPANNWYFGPHNLGKGGDSLIVWGRYLLDVVGFDELRLDAVKHIEPGFLAPFLVELHNGNQPFAVGELFDGNLGTLKGYHDEVENFVSTYGVGSKDANLAIFDFNLRYALRDLCNDGGGGYDMWNLNNTGLVLGGGVSGYDVVTFVENHDVDRIGWQVVNCSDPLDPGVLQIGGTCMELYTDGTHDPVFSDKEDMAYPYIMAAEGRPTVFWKDIFWYGLDDDITWQMALREATATGTSGRIQDLNPFFTSGHGGDLFVLNRYGLTSGVSDGMVLALNDNPSSEASVWVNTPFSNKYLKDYSDGYMFVTTQAYADSRANVKAQPRDYAWWSVTGLYPKPPGMGSNYFKDNYPDDLTEPGGCPHYIVLRAADAGNLLVNGSPIAAGDEVAVLNSTGNIAGIGRIGQSTQWDGVHDMVIEVLGAPSANGMGNGEQFRFVVYDASASAPVTIGYVQYAPVGDGFTFEPDRPDSPNRNGGVPVFNLTATRAGLYDCEGISRVLAFDPPEIPLAILCGVTSQADAGVYNDGLQAGDNDGTFFLPWTLVNVPGDGSLGGIFTGSTSNVPDNSSKANGDGDSNGDGDINTGGKAWGFYANSGNTVDATRPFASPLPVGGTFSMQMDNGWIEGGGTVGFGLRNSSNENVWEFFFAGGSSFYSINEGSGVVPTSVGFTDEGLALEFLLTSTSTYSLKLTEIFSGNTTVYTGTLKTPAGGSTIDRVRLFNANAGFDPPRNAYFNSFHLCDPPALIINEVDYDQPGADNAEFVELRNMNTTPLNLDEFRLELVNGTGVPYYTVNLPSVSLAPGDHFVACGGGYSGAECDFTFSNAIQNGAPDAVRLVWNSITIDALSYEGDVTGAVEGSGIGLEDNESAADIGLSRVPNGIDTDQNNVDFELACITPGEANPYSSIDTDNDGAPDDCDICPLAKSEGGISNFDVSTCACELGYYAVYGTENGQQVITGCQQCPPGTFCPDGIHSYPCPAGAYQTAAGQSSCTPCAAGTYSTVEGASSSSVCTACLPGTYQNQEGSTSCKVCQEGTYNPNPGAQFCEACPQGTYAQYQGQIVCETCPAGTEAPFAGSAECTNCNPPTFDTCPPVTPVSNTPGQCDALVTVPIPELSGLCTRNHALDFDGADDYVDLGNLDVISTGTPGQYTVELWVKLDAYNPDYTYLFGDEQSYNQGILFEISPTGYVTTFHPVVGRQSSTNIQIPLDAWVQIALVQDGSTVTSYVNGVFDAQLLSSPNLHIETALATNLGRFPLGGRFLDGQMDEVRVWDYARTQTDIQNSMDLEINSTYPGLVAFYNFNQGISCCDNTGLTTLPDGMGAHDGTLNNFALSSGCTSNWAGGAWALGDSLKLVNDFNTSCDVSGTYLLGATTVTWTATGANGQTATCVQTVTVNDAEPPTASCQNITVDLVSPGAYTLTAAEIDNNSTDNCPANLDLSISPTTFSCSDVGSTIPVTLTVSDGTNSTTCTAQVTVADGNALCNVPIGITILDPCSCLDNATTLTNGQFSETIKVTGPGGDTWTVVAAPGLYQAASPPPPAAPLPVGAGTLLVEGPSGTYTLTGKHVDALGYSVVVTNGTETLSISNTCYYPNPNLSGLNSVYCTQDGSQTATVTAQLGDGSGPATIENILFELIRQSDNFVVDSQSGNPYSFDPSTLSTGLYTLRVTFDAGDDGDGHPGCVQEVEEAFEVRKVGCGAFPWGGN